MSSPLAELTYEGLSNDLVRYRDDELDATIATIVAEAINGDDLDGFRCSLDDGDRDLLTTFARRRIVSSLRTLSHDALAQAYDAYAVLTQLSEGELNAWFKGGLLVARACAMETDILRDRFVAVATRPSAEMASVVFASADRLDHFAQCYLVETDTRYGKGLLNTAVDRDQPSDQGIGALTGAIPDLNPFRSGYDTAGRVASLAAALADAFDAQDDHASEALRHDRLVASSFDIVTSGSFLETRACVSFFVTGPDGLDFSVVVAEIDPTVTLHSAMDLAAMADELVDQAAAAHDTVVVLLSVVPNFDDLFRDEVADEVADEDDSDEVNDDPVGHYLELVSAVLTAQA